MIKWVGISVDNDFAYHHFDGRIDIWLAISLLAHADLRFPRLHYADTIEAAHSMSRRSNLIRASANKVRPARGVMWQRASL